MKQNNTKPRLFQTLALAGALSGLGGCAVEADTTNETSEGEAPIALGSVFGFVRSFYQSVFDVAALMKKKPEDPATRAAREITAHIDEAKGEILDALADARWENQQFVAADLEGRITTVLTNFEGMTEMSPTDPDLLPMRRETQMLAQNVLNEFASIVNRKVAIELSYELAPAYNVLLAAYVGILKMKTELTPAEPMPISFFQTALSDGVQTNYKLVGARQQGCSGSQYIPRRDQMFVGRSLNGLSGDLVGPVQDFAFRESQLFKEKFGALMHVWRGEYTCILKTNMCTAPSYYTGSNNGLPQPCSGPTVSEGMATRFANCLSSAQNYTVKEAFDNDPTVGFIRVSLASMLKLGAVTVATAGGGFPGTNPAVGSYFDPVIKAPYASYDGACEAGRRTYIMQP